MIVEKSPNIEENVYNTICERLSYFEINVDKIRSEWMHIILEALDDADSIRIIRPDMNALDSIQATVGSSNSMRNSGFITLNISHIGFIGFDLGACGSLKTVHTKWDLI